MSRSEYLFNCDTGFSQQNCHYSCGEYDCPTYEDCLSCSEDSQRIYLSDYICPYFTFDDVDCKSYQNLQWQPISNLEQNVECKYRQFEVNGQCDDCPGIRNQEVITYLECILDPKGWSKIPICQLYLQIKQDGSISKLQKLDDFPWRYYFTLMEQILNYLLIVSNHA